MKRRGFIGTFLACAAMLVPLAACGAFTDYTPTYRYRLTAEVETPDGLRTGSSAIEVDTNVASEYSIPTPGALRHRVRGEAAAVDLSEGRVMFALLRSEQSVDWASGILFWVTPYVKSDTEDSYITTFRAMLGRKTPVTLPRTLAPFIPSRSEESAYPMLVTFADLADPTSVEEVDPDDLAATFGEGVRLRRITVQITDDPVTTGIEKRLGWLGDPSVMENPGWGTLPIEAREKIIGLHMGQIGTID